MISMLLLSSLFVLILFAVIDVVGVGVGVMIGVDVVGVVVFADIHVGG